MKKSMRWLPVLVAACSLLLTDVVLAQPGGGGGGRQRGMGMAGFGGGTMGLLNDERVQGELELVDDQIEELRAIQQSAQESMRDMFSEMQDLPPEERRDFMTNMRGRLQDRMKEFEDEANQVLLPHQKQRLKQLVYQSSGRRGGAGGTLANEDLLEELGVTDEQRKQLEEARTRAQQELQKKYAELLRAAEDDVLKVLTKDQRNKYRELVGDAFDFQANNPGMGRGGFGNRRGNPGGDPRGNRDGGQNRSDF